MAKKGTGKPGGKVNIGRVSEGKTISGGRAGGKAGSTRGKTIQGGKGGGGKKK